VSQESTNRSFDDLARALAEGSLSRRRALRLFAGTALAALIPSRALADDDDDCVRICHVPFDRETGRCFFGQRENRCVPRNRVQVHLEEHPCDCRGRCRNCQRPTTTTSTTSTSTSTSTTSTSTTTPTTSTSTSTTSTSTTTTMCLPDFSTPCTADTQCCSGVCGFQGPGPNTFCVASRPPGAICTADTQCLDDRSGIRACVNGRCCTTGPCNDTTPCCPGSGCVNGVCRS
jgi:hypothetical protein